MIERWLMVKAMRTNLPHILLDKKPETRKFISINGGRKKDKEYRPNILHGHKLYKDISSIINQDNPENLPDNYTVYITIEGTEELLGVLASLKKKKKSVNIKASTIKTDDGINYKIILCVNKKYLTSFYKKINGYISEITKKGKPKNQDLMNEVESIAKSVIDDLWIGAKDLIPQKDLKKWCEIWILENNPNDFLSICDKLNIKYNKNSLIKFIERTVIRIEVSGNDMANLLLNYPLIGEFRPVNSLSSFWTDLCQSDQNEWAGNLLSRLKVEQNPSTIISVLDTGVNNGHPLLNNFIPDEFCNTCNTDWKSNDNDGHGTEMCGIAAYGNLQKCLETSSDIEIKHGVSSVKILPEGRYKNEEVSYGAITNQAIARLKIVHSKQNIISCLAVTEDESPNIEGLPSSWSATLDMISSGQNLETPDIENINDKKLLIVSGGNIDDTRMKYPDDNKTMPIQSPAQAWNVLTIGAYTQKDDVVDKNKTLAKHGGLSPYSRTSFTWKNSTCPIKPEVLFEGGNKVADEAYNYQSAQHSVLTTNGDFTKSFFGLCSGTSPATAEASNFAAKLQTQYPNLWAETIRGLIIHSAEWTDEMKRQFLPKNPGKTSYENILRTCGYGVPNMQNAMYSAQNSLVMIAQNEIQPYILDGNRTKTNEMHLYELPWAKKELLDLGETEVAMKITLSYFIEPAPFSMGKIPNNKYRYASYGLRFDINRPNEEKDFFIKKINKKDGDLAKSNGEELSSRESSKWLYGENTGIYNGSVHSNVWKGTAAELATSNILAVYPVMGWWKDRKSLERYNKKTRYSLIVSIKTPSIETDIYTPIKNSIAIPVPNEINA